MTTLQVMGHGYSQGTKPVQCLSQNLRLTHPPKVHKRMIKYGLLTKHTST